MSGFVEYRPGASVRVSVRMNPEHWDRLRAEGENLGLSRSQIMRGLLRNWVDRRGTKAHLALTETGQEPVFVRVKLEFCERLEERASGLGLSTGEVLRGVVGNWIKRGCDPKLIGETIA